jgi:DedD protein
MASENELPDNEDVKKKALARLAVAGLVTVAALAGLWWLDQGKKAPPDKMPQAPQPAPIRPAQAPEPALPTAEPPPETPAGLGTQEEPTETVAPPEAPPPPRVSNAPRIPQPPVEPAPARQAAPAAQPVMPPPTQQPPALPATAATGSFVVQLGVFANPTGAEELVRQLKSKGIRASTETRVHVGPFLNRQEAEKAQAEMRRLGINGIVTTAAPTK